jgi:hypothetical protein
MFRKNGRPYQANLFGIVHQFPPGVKKMLDKSWAPAFRKLIFERIDEKRYAELYSDIASRPNFPVNIWVGLEIIKGLSDYTDEELLEQFHFNLLTAYALGLDGLGELTLCVRTVYYNRKRLLEYEARTGRNLLKEEFEHITDDTLKRLGLDPSTQRMDSSFVGSYIKQMSRLELVVKVLQNFYHDLPEAEQASLKPRLAEYVEEEAEHISFRLRRGEIEEHLKKVGELLFELHEAYAAEEKISCLKSYRHIGRVLKEQFNIVKGREKTTIEVKPGEEISAASLQNPADEEATFRRKGEEEQWGYLLNVAETCSKDNPLQLLTDVDVYPNVASDEAILAEELPQLKERTGVDEMITDANYTGEVSEKVCKEQGVELIPTEVKGRRASEEKPQLQDFKFEGDKVILCPANRSPVAQIHKVEKGRHLIHFSREQCSGCPLVGKCPVQERKRFYSLGFSERQSLLARRRQQLGKEEYREKCRLRAAIEGTVSQFKQRMHNGKLKVRGHKRVRNVIITMAIAINFERVWAYMLANGLDLALFSVLAAILLMVLAGSLDKARMRRSLTAQWAGVG